MFFCFFKEKTADEMRISDWRSDVCSSDLWNFAVVRIEAEVAFDDALTDRALRRLVTKMEAGRRPPWTVEEMGDRYPAMRAKVIGFRAVIRVITPRFKQIGRASCRERVCQYV